MAGGHLREPGQLAAIARETPGLDLREGLVGGYTGPGGEELLSGAKVTAGSLIQLAPWGVKIVAP